MIITPTLSKVKLELARAPLVVVFLSDDSEKVLLFPDGDFPHGLLQAGLIRRRSGRCLDHVPIERRPAERGLAPAAQI